MAPIRPGAIVSPLQCSHTFFCDAPHLVNQTPWGVLMRSSSQLPWEMLHDHPAFWMRAEPGEWFAEKIVSAGLHGIFLHGHMRFWMIVTYAECRMSLGFWLWIVQLQHLALCCKYRSMCQVLPVPSGGATFRAQHWRAGEVAAGIFNSVRASPLMTRVVFWSLCSLYSR